MLSIGKVYLYNNARYVFVSKKGKRKGKTVYKVRKVNLDGSLGIEEIVKFQAGKFKVVKKYKLHIHVELPKVNRNKIRYESVLSNAKTLIVEIKKHRSNDSKIKLAKLAIAVCDIPNQENKNGRYNLRDFAKSLGFKTYRKMYLLVGAYLKTQYTPKKYQRLKTAADSTIVGCVRNYEAVWSSLHGFNKELDGLLEMDFKAYTSEVQKRGIYYEQT